MYLSYKIIIAINLFKANFNKSLLKKLKLLVKSYRF